jgi:hypothetical protein
MTAPPLATGPVSPDRLRSLVRWKLGHQIFHIYLTAMNSLLDESFEELAAREWRALSAALDHLTTLYDASTAGMRYAADIAPEDYAAVVRPSMEPPFMSPGFSGVMNREHREMLAAVRRLRSAIRAETAAPPPSVQDAWSRLEDAQRRNRASHELVCRRFVPNGVSLLREFNAERRRREKATRKEDNHGDGRRAVVSRAGDGP